MNQADIRSAAITLAARRLSGSRGPLLAGVHAPQTLSEALAVQQQVSEVLNDGVGGWKCGLPTHEHVVLAPIYTSMLSHASPCPAWARDGMISVEPELAFVFDEGLPARRTGYAEADIRSAITRAHLALELIDSRYDLAQPVPYLQSLADGLVNQGLLLGPDVSPDAAFVCNAMQISLSVKGGKTVFAGAHPAGSPLMPLYWLVNYLGERGQATLPGQAIITGSFAGVIQVPVDTELEWQFGDLGDWRCELQARCI